LKRALRRTYLAWDKLHGEVDFDHLLAVNVLRAGAPGAFNFVLHNRAALAEDPRSGGHDQTERQRVQERLRQEWTQVTGGVDWDSRAALSIVELLFPTAGLYLGDRGVRGQERPQGVTESRFWLRLLREELDPRETRDQVVLGDMLSWLSDPGQDGPLVRGVCGGGEYGRVWEDYASRDVEAWTGARVLQFASCVLAHLQTPGASWRAQGEDPDSLFPVLRVVQSRLRPEDHYPAWLEGEVRAAVRSSLPLAESLYCYFTSNRCLDAKHRVQIRRLIHDVAREEYTSGERLLRVLHPEMHYDLYRLVYPPVTAEGPSELRGPLHWRWLAPAILQAARLEPGRMSPRVVHLLAGPNGTGAANATDGRPADLFNPEHLREVLEVLRNQREAITVETRSLLDGLLVTLLPEAGSQDRPPGEGPSGAAAPQLAPVSSPEGSL
jgi:hypothetical protein